MSYQKDSGPDCARAWELMPWALLSTAPPDQTEWLTEHLAHCESCSTEFAQQSRLRCALTLPCGIRLDADAGFKRLLERLDVPVPETLPSRLRPGNRLAVALAVAVLVQAIGLGVLGVRLWMDQPPPYRTLSQPAPLQPAGAIRVVPAAGLSLPAWDNMLGNLDLRVVDGPNAVGAYIVVPKGSPTESARLLKELRASASIRLAEPVERTP
jgi:hypothetical protein